MRHFLTLLVFVLLVINVCVLWFVLEPVKSLTVAFLDVGQGDAIFIETPSGKQMLIDGGKGRSVLRELGKEMGLFDRSLDIVVATHPDADHIGGLSEVFTRYTVRAYVTPGRESDSTESQALGEAVATEKGLEEVVARRGMRIDLGDGVYADILFPDRDVSRMETNAGSIIMRLVYNNTSFMLTGDAPDEIETYLASLEGDALQSDVLKAGHHGSRTSTGDPFIQAVDPDYVIISAGKDNSYGHPHEDVVERIAKSGAQMHVTADEGTIVIMSDGETLTIK